MSEYVYAGLTSQTIDIFLQDRSSTTGAGLSGLVYNSAGLVASYRKGATGSRVAITLATQTVAGAYSSGGFVEIDATDMKGVYRLDIPNAAVDTEGFVTLYLYGATNLLPTALRIDCRAVPADLKKIGGDTQSATDLKDFADAGYDPSTNKVQGVVLVDTTTTNTDMRGTDDAMLAASYTAPDNASITAILEDTGTTLPVQIATLNSRMPGTVVERTTSDTSAITFSWPVSGATITGEVSLNNAAYGAVAGAIAFLRTEEGLHYYTLAYNAADRPSSEGAARYKLDDGAYTRFVNLRIDPSNADQSAVEVAITAATSPLATATNVSDVQTAILAKLPAALVSGRIDASVGAMATDVVTAAAVKADAVTKIQANLATEAYIAQILTTYVVEVF